MNLLSVTKKTYTLAAVVASLILPAMTAQADRRDNKRWRHKTVTYQIDRSSIQDLNNSGRLGLKRAIRESGRTLANNAKLIDVEILGRATGRRSLVSLKINGQTVDSAILPRGRRDRGRDHRRRPELSTTILSNPSLRNSDGAWRIISESDTKIRRITVTVREGRRPNNNHRLVSLGSKKATKFVGRNTNFSVHKRGVNKVAIKANANDLQVSHVTVHYNNGDYEILRDLHGLLHHGRTKTVHLRRTRGIVSHINVEAYSPNSFGSTARIEVLINQDTGHRRR